MVNIKKVLIMLTDKANKLVEEYKPTPKNIVRKTDKALKENRYRQMFDKFKDAVKKDKSLF
jgi:hypothetical protein